MSDELLKKLADSVEALQAQNAQNARMLETLATGYEKLQQKGSGSNNDDEGKGGRRSESVDLESMNRAEFANYIAETLITHVKKEMIDPIETRFTGYLKAEGTSKVKNAIKDLIEKDGYRDFHDWNPEITALIRGNPNLTLKQAYKLVKEDPENAEKVEKLEEKYKMGKFEKPKDEPGTPKPRAFGGFTPGGAQHVNEKQDMKPKEAAKAAFDTVFGDRPLPE